MPGLRDDPVCRRVQSRLVCWGGLNFQTQTQSSDTIVLWTGIHDISIHHDASVPVPPPSSKASAAAPFTALQAVLVAQLRQDMLCLRFPWISCG